MSFELSRREVVRLIAGAAAGAALPARAGPDPRPNVVVFVTDDQRQDAMSAYGNPVLKTPNMDRIAAGGVRFTEAFVTNSLCAPSRASLLTGLYSHVHGVISNGGGPELGFQGGLHRDQQTFVHLLRDAGYFTGLVGKWHLKALPTGFDRWVIFPGQGVYQDPEMYAGELALQMRGHADDVVGDQALKFLEKRPAGRPFILVCGFKSPHRSWTPAPRYATALDGVDIPLPRTYEDRLDVPESLKKAQLALADLPDFNLPATLPRDEKKRQNYAALVKNYYRVLMSADDNIGRVLDALDLAGAAANTLVIFTSDNGFFLGEHGLYDKRLMYEASIRVPLLVRLPSRFPKPRVDEKSLVLNIDVAPTVLDLAGVPVPPWMQGRTLVPLLAGKRTAWRDAFLYEYFEYPAEHCVRRHRGVRTERWKLIHFWESPEVFELYDLAADRDETRNLAGRPEHAAVQQQLVARLAELRRETGDVDQPWVTRSVAECAPGVNDGYAKPPWR